VEKILDIGEVKGSNDGQFNSPMSLAKDKND